MKRDPLDDLVAHLDPLRASLLSHPIYGRVGELAHLRTFMRSHVFAVRDFMALLKTLQRRLTCVEVPWLPAANPDAARLVNSIVLAEETDEVRPQVFISHFELYLEGMREVGADTAPIAGFVAALRAGCPAGAALEALPIPQATRAFVLGTLALTARPTHEIAAAFLLGREALVPDMFAHVLEGLGERSGAFRLYLERHIELDGQDHAPKAGALVRVLCGDDPGAWEAARLAATSAVEARLALWDGVLAAMEATPPPGEAAINRRD
jgi:hypothetical protein